MLVVVSVRSDLLQCPRVKYSASVKSLCHDCLPLYYVETFYLLTSVWVSEVSGCLSIHTVQKQQKKCEMIRVF